MNKTTRGLCVGAILFLALASLQNQGPALGQQTKEGVGDSTRQSQSVDKVIKVFYLQHVEAKAAYDTIGQVFADELYGLSKDSQQNLLIAGGTAESLARVEKLLGEIDVEKKPKPSNRLTYVYRLSHVAAQDIARTLNDLLSSERRSNERPIVVAEQSSNSLIVSCVESNRGTIEDLIKRLDIAVVKQNQTDALPENIVIRVTWLVDDSEQDPELAKLLRETNKSLEKLTSGLRSSGAVQSTKSLTQSQTTVIVDLARRRPHSFQCNGLRTIGTRLVSVHAGGQVQLARDGKYELDLALKLSDNSAELEVESTVLISKNHPLAFSVADVGAFKSVVVIEVLDSE